MKNVIEEANARVRIQEGTRVIEQLLLECYFKPGISTKELARKTLLPVPVAAAIKKELIKEGVLEQERGVRCTAEGNAYIENDWGYKGLDKTLYQKLAAKETDWRSELPDVLSSLRDLFQARPQVNVQIDQSKCTPETSLARAILCLRDHSLIGKKVLCVGDDDFVSVSLGFLLKRLFPDINEPKATIHVADIDERFLSYIREIAGREGLPVTCHRLDLRQPLPEELQGRYDCFFTDPPYTLQGLNLFISRGISGLKKAKGLPIFLSFAHKAPDVLLAIQREFVRMGLVAKEVIPHFNEYEGAEMIGNRSQMIVLKTTEQTAPDIGGAFEDALYTGEVKRTVRTYRCKQCGHSAVVGFQEDIVTVEQLKNEGCRVCANDTFDLIGKKTAERSDDLSP
ncbi:bis-aminopropyl spermidine synthase family protein [Paenibacillus contaminans]|uniref:Putative methyltransferase n=1 Tax=Paenibacillus contaminans TaxID=450362 RepID=A0A329MSM0_9BACL|nr:bis-aminopropyl spermidine synthase family protein [Paenibacillus contaminans]RAV22356.1 putative methyltransferase [Paenibacillus contaminans]